MAEAGVERRLTTILAADVVGYSGLMGTDEIGTLAQLKTHRKELIEPKTAEYHGRIVKLIGDGMLMEFGSVVDAVCFAVDVQRAMAERNAEVQEDRRITFRIGINIGDVIVEGEDIYGDGVNVAARLEALCEPGGVLVSRVVFDQVRDKLSFCFEDMGEQIVKNIARPIGLHKIHFDLQADETATKSSSAARIAEGSIATRPTIVVLPFANMSGDPEQEYFADGISEDITTGLSKLRWFFVIARNSAFVYKGKAVDVNRVTRELGVRYVLEGSVRKGGNRVRITAQLIDAATGNHLWADHYDGELKDIFELQDEITQKVVAAIEPKLLEAEGTRMQSRSPDDLDAWDTVARANFLFWRLSKSDTEDAISTLWRAVERYPSYAPAHSMLAFMLAASSYMGSDPLGPQISEAAPLAARAEELDDSDPWAHLALGYVAFIKRRTDEAVSEFQRALDLNPNFAAAHGYLGWTLAFAGRTDEAMKHLEVALRLSPHDPQNAIFNTGIAIVHYLSGRFSEAIVFARKALQQRSGFSAGNRIYVASLAQAGQIEEARAVLASLKEHHQDLSIAWIEQHVPYTSDAMAKFVEGMRKAGLN